MRFEYNSVSRGGVKKELKQAVVDDLREYLLANTNPTMTLGQLQEVFLRYRTPIGDALLIHQMEPMFLYCAIYGRVWE